MPQPHPLEHTLNELLQSSRRLNELTDAANHTIQHVEDWLATCSLGIDAAVAFEQHGEWTWTLEYLHYNDRPRIAVVETFMDNTDRADITPWVECSREHKLKSFVKLPELLTIISKKLDEQLDLAEQSVAAAAKAIELLHGKTSQLQAKQGQAKGKQGQAKGKQGQAKGKQGQAEQKEDPWDGLF